MENAESAADREDADAGSPRPMPLSEWLECGKPASAALLVGADLDLAELYQDFMHLPVIVIEFPSFMDGRGFSHAQKLREMGYSGELIAGGDVLPDQWQSLQRCGFSGLVDDATTQEALSLQRFSDSYQAHATQPEPLFRRVPRGRRV